MGTEENWKKLTKYEYDCYPPHTVVIHYNSTFPTQITLYVSDIELPVHSTKTIHTTITPSDATVQKIKWISSNTDIVSCSDDGEVMAYGIPGTAVITAETVNDLTVFCTVTVTNPCATLEHQEVTDPVVAATCTENGLTEGTHCSVYVVNHIWDSSF